MKWKSSTHDKLIPRLLESFNRKKTNNIINNNISNISSGNYLTRGKVGDIEDTHVKLVEMVSVVIVLIDELGHSGQLDVCCALINGTNFTISVVFLYGVVFSEAYPSHPFDAFRCG